MGVLNSLLHFSVAIACSANAVLSRNDLEKGYYWREYSGDILPDALSATMDKPGPNVYIVQTMHEGSTSVYYPTYSSRAPGRGFGSSRSRGSSSFRGSYSWRQPPRASSVNSCKDRIGVTGQIREGRKEMEYEWGSRRQTAKQNVQILCTHNPTDFEWLETNTSAIVHLQDRHFVSGGTEKNYVIYIGRITLKDKVLVGKVLHTNLSYKDGFYSATNYSFVHIYSAFEVLAYNPLP